MRAVLVASKLPSHDDEHQMHRETSPATVEGRLIPIPERTNDSKRKSAPKQLAQIA
jgi:hypothetical protein